MKIGISTEIFEKAFFVYIQTDSCHKNMLLESLNILLNAQVTVKLKRQSWAYLLQGLF